MDVPKALKLAWAQIALAFLIGVGLSWVPAHGWTAPIHHVGIGLLVAAVVTTFWQFREFSEYFEKYAQAILVHDDHLKKLSMASLVTLRSRADEAILTEFVTNPRFERKALTKWIDDLLYTKLLPGGDAGSGVYRDSFEDEICIEYPTLREALTALKIDLGSLSDEALDVRILKVTSTTTYTAVAPKLNEPAYQTYTVPFSGKGADLPNFPIDKRVLGRVGTSEATAATMNLAFKDEPLGGISYSAASVALPFVQGSCHVWMRTIEYRSPQRESHVLNTMSTLTHNLSVHLYRTGPGPNVVFDGDMLAAGVGAGPKHSPHSVTLKYNGWLFEDNGYYLWWWEK